jgi:DNA primase large subunit
MLLYVRTDAKTARHIGYTCDTCKQSPIVGPRYQCIGCTVDVNLCASCEAIHDPAHPKAKFTVPLPLIR